MLRRDPGSSQVLNNIITQTQLATPLGAELEAQANPSLCSAAGTLPAAGSHVGAIAGCWDLQTLSHQQRTPTGALKVNGPAQHYCHRAAYTQHGRHEVISQILTQEAPPNRSSVISKNRGETNKQTQKPTDCGHKKCPNL